MPYFSKEEIARAREMDLLTYLQNYEPTELVHVTGNTWTTATHDSLKISNGKWMWWSRGFGGASALDYLVKVRGDPFIDAVGKILGKAAGEPSIFVTKPKPDRARRLLLPERAENNDRVTAYLMQRGISRSIIEECIDRGLLYESLPYHNAVFVGFDGQGAARYASFRATVPEKIMGEATGSDKKFSFRIGGTEDKTVLHIFESVIDLLSFASIRNERGQNWQAESMLSLGGVYAPSSPEGRWKMPAALSNVIEADGEIREIAMHLDNDYAGRAASGRLAQMLGGRYRIRDEPPVFGKDMNDELMERHRRRAERRKERQSHER